MVEEINSNTTDFSRLALKILSILIIGFSGFLVLWLGGYAVFQIWHAGRILPGIVVGDIHVGGLTPEEAGVKLYMKLDLTENNKTDLILPDGLQEADLLALGVRLDAAATAMDAFQTGRGLLNGQWIAHMFHLYPDGYQVNPTIIFDQQSAYDYLLLLSQQINQPVVEASLHLEGTQVVATPGQPGFILEIPASMDRINTQIVTGSLDQVALVVNQVEPDLKDASPFIATAEKILSRPLMLRVPAGQPDSGRTWEIEPVDVAPMLTFPKVNDNGTASITPHLDDDALFALLADVSSEATIAAENPRFVFNDETRQLDLLSSAVIGRQLNIEESARSIQDMVSHGDLESTLVFNFIHPEVINEATASDLGITELVHEESSYFFGSSSSRIHNIEVAAGEFHGMLVAPGQTFSMAAAMGDVSLDAGYTEALIIYDGRTIEGVGGGVCQVSTTLFRAAFFAGFPIVERHPHAYRVSYYEKTATNKRDSNLAGLDATVYVPIVDLKFTNDTPYWLLMETYINRAANRITWKFYSTSDHRSVEWQTTGPINIVEPKKPIYTLNPQLEPGEIKQVDWEADGADVLVNRTVYRNGSMYFEDSFSTHYTPWRAVFEYGHGVDGIPTQNDDD